eukprot:3073388-Rhodomonas_salina.2
MEGSEEAETLFENGLPCGDGETSALMRCATSATPTVRSDFFVTFGRQVQTHQDEILFKSSSTKCVNPRSDGEGWKGIAGLQMLTWLLLACQGYRGGHHCGSCQDRQSFAVRHAQGGWEKSDGSRASQGRRAVCEAPCRWPSRLRRSLPLSSHCSLVCCRTYPATATLAFSRTLFPTPNPASPQHHATSATESARPGIAAGVPYYTIEYESESTRGNKHFIACVAINKKKLYVLTAQAKIDSFPKEEQNLRRVVASFRLTSPA